MTTRFQAPRGTQDVLPEMQPYWEAVYDAIRVVTQLHGFRRIDTPVFEYAGVFEKGSGDTTDIIEKEMYTFEDRGGEKLALTPEATPAICRSYLEHGMGSWPQPVRLFTTHQMFRYDRPQKGRYRQHTQFDVEILGSTDPLIDAEVIAVLWRLYTMLGIRNAGVRLGSLDDLQPRRAYVERLKDYYRPHLDKLSEDSQRRFERNPLRLLDSKDERDLPFKEAAPKLVDSLSDEAREHHETVMGALEATEIPVEVDPLLVRGLDYYNRTVFEIVPTDDERAQGTIGGGGRYDGLVELLGGPPTPGMGFGSGIERMIIEMQRNGVTFDERAAADVYIVNRAAGGSSAVFALASRLRSAGIPAICGEANKSMKAQMRGANHSGAKFAVIVGDDELAKGIGMVKDLAGEAEQTAVPFDRIPANIQAKLRA
ncbi:MAG: histidine--tRNA ligase [Dehalococcoidia bacterium]